MVKVCGNCGYRNREESDRCEDCGWKLPKVDTATKLGHGMQRVAAGIFALSLLQCLMAIGSGEYSLGLSLLCALIGSVAAAILFWIGAFLKGR